MTTEVTVRTTASPALADQWEADALTAIGEVTTPEAAESLLAQVKFAEQAVRLAELGRDRYRRWGVVRLRAERRWGELLGDAEPGGHNVRLSDRQSDSDYKARQRARQLAAALPEIFEDYITSADEPTRAGLLRKAASTRGTTSPAPEYTCCPTCGQRVRADQPLKGAQR